MSKKKEESPGVEAFDKDLGAPLFGRGSVFNLGGQYRSIAKIATALIKAQAEMTDIKKGGRNTDQGYNYAELEDFVDIVRPIMAKHSLALFCSTEEAKHLDIRTTKSGSKQYPVSVLIRGTLLHESGEWLEGSSRGEGQDFGDKGTYKAITGARKYLLASFFNLATSDDPERNEKIDKDVGKAVQNQDRETIEIPTKEITAEMAPSAVEKVKAIESYRPAPNPDDEDGRTVEDHVYDIFNWIVDMAAIASEAGMHPDQFWPAATKTEYQGKSYCCNNREEAGNRIKDKLNSYGKYPAVFIWQRNVEDMMKKMAVKSDGEHGEKMPWDEEDPLKHGKD